jgi:hypothetical protein
MNHSKPTPKSNFEIAHTHTLVATGHIKFDHNLIMSKKHYLIQYNLQVLHKQCESIY